MKYKKYIWIFFIFVLTIAVTYLMQRTASKIEGFMTDDEYITEVFNRIKAIQIIKASITASLDEFDKSVKDTCDLTPQYRNAYVTARSELPDYAYLPNDDRQKNAREDYDEERLNVISSGTPIYECFANPEDIDNATSKLKSEIKELSGLLNSRRLRTMLQKGKLLYGLQVMNSTFSGTKLATEGFANINTNLLDAADVLIKDARKIQTISRTVVTNASRLTSDLVKIPEFVRNRYTAQNKDEKRQIYSDLINDNIVTQLFGSNTYLQLLYKSSRDGYSSSVFHTKSDNQGPTLTVFRTSTGRIAGGYAPVSWKKASSYVYLESGKAFLFNVVDNKVKKYFNRRKLDNSLYDGPSYFPTFGGGHDLYFTSGATAYSEPYTYLNSNTDLVGSQSFQVTEMEVFKVT